MIWKGSAEHYARVERERRLGEPYFVALVRLAYEDLVADKGEVAGAWELLGYIRHAGPPVEVAAVLPVAAPAPAKRPGPKKGWKHSEETRARMKASQQEYQQRRRMQAAFEKESTNMRHFPPAQL